jgi:Gram-negative bacterial TonB protein C-terminal
MINQIITVMKKTLLLLSIFFVQFVFGQAPLSAVKSIPLNYDAVEVRPEFPGGVNEFIKFIGKNYRTPEVEGLSGVVKVSFVIEINGTISDVKIVKDIGSGAGEEAKRVVLLSPKWTPGEQIGKPVRVLYELPITIKGY